MRRNKITRYINAVKYRMQYSFEVGQFVIRGVIGIRSKGKLVFLAFFISVLFREMFLYLKYFLKKPNIPIAKFILFGQGKTGCSLVANLLESYPQFQYDDEILTFMNFFPKLGVKAMCALSKKKVYGIKILMSQLNVSLDIQGAKKFMHELHSQGWKIIYLKRRNILQQAVEQLMLKFHLYERLFWFWKKAPLKQDIVYLDCKKVIKRIKKDEIYSAQEAEVLANLPHLSIVFEDDLLRVENHQKAIDKVFAYLGLPSVPVKTIFVKTFAEQQSISIQNYEEVRQAISQTKYAKFLED